VIGAAFRLLILGNRRFLIGHALAGADAGLVGLLVSGAFLLVAVADASDGLAHGDDPSSKKAAGPVLHLRPAAVLVSPG
jgi:hypothetical protein